MLFTMIGWLGTIIMLIGSVFNIKKNILCWPLWLFGGVCIITQGIYLQLWNVVILQLMYVPIELVGWRQWRREM